MKTDELIQKLSIDFKNPSPSKNWFVRYWSLWSFCIIILCSLTYGASLWVPDLIHIPEGFGDAVFRMELFMWLGIALLASTVAYLSSIPRKSNSFLIPGIYAALSALVISLLIRFDYSNWAEELFRESHLKQGPCGFFIVLTGALATLSIFSLMRRAAAPTEQKKTATWASLSLGAFSALLMHLVCTHDSSLHIFVWHILPMTFIVISARLFSKKLLYW